MEKTKDPWLLISRFHLRFKLLQSEISVCSDYEHHRARHEHGNEAHFYCYHNEVKYKLHIYTFKLCNLDDHCQGVLGFWGFGVVLLCCVVLCCAVL